MKRKTDKVKTMTALAGHFSSLQRGKRVLDTEYLNNSIIIYLDNKECLYNAMMNRRRKATAVAWMAFGDLAGDFVNQDYGGTEGVTYYAGSQQLKEFLKMHGCGYEALADSVKYIEQARKEAEKEEETGHVEA